MKIGPLPAAKLGKTVLDKLIPTVAKVRQIATNLGARRYRVFIVRASWSGKTPGEGDLTISQRVEILPTPMVNGLSQLTREAGQGGLHERGGIKVDEIVPRSTTHPTYGMSEDDLLANSLSRPLTAAERFWVEIQEDGAVDKPAPVAGVFQAIAPVRRFRVRGSPELDIENIQYILRLERIEQDKL